MEISLPYTLEKLRIIFCISIQIYMSISPYYGLLWNNVFKVAFYCISGNTCAERPALVSGGKELLVSLFLALTLCSSSSRASAACSALWRLSGCSVWGEWPGSWTTTLNMEQPCWSCWCVCSGWLLTGWPASGTASGTMRSLTRTRRPSVTTAGSTSWQWTLAPLTSLTGPAQGNGKGVPARIPCTSPRCISPWPASPVWALGTSPHPQTSRRSLQWPSWWLVVSMPVAGARGRGCYVCPSFLLAGNRIMATVPAGSGWYSLK